MKLFQMQSGLVTAIFILIFANLSYTQVKDSGVTVSPPSDFYTLAIGTEISLRMENEINSGSSEIGDTFTALVSEPVKKQERLILPAGSIVSGTIVRVSKRARNGKNGELTIRFDRIVLPNSVSRRLDAELVTPILQKESKGKRILIVAISSAIGAIVGGLSNSGKGAALGAGIGAGAGAGASAAIKGKDISIGTEKDFKIRLTKAVTFPPREY